MPNETVKLLIALLVVTLLCSCAGGMSFRKEVELPEEKIAALAAQIEDVVLNTTLDEITISEIETGGQADEPIDELDPMSVMIGMDEIRRKIPALAELNMDNEIVLSAIRGRVLRREAVREFQENGCVGENRRGLLQYLGGSWCAGDRYTRDRASYVILADNRDRRVIYEQVVEANGFGKSAMNRVREIFAMEIFTKAWAGTPLETTGGSWERR